MSTIKKNVGKNGKLTFSVYIKKKDFEICKTFYTLEDAKIYSFYKERLIQNMENFDVPLNERITLNQIIDLKIESATDLSVKTITQMQSMGKKFSDFFGKNRFYHTITYADWIDSVKYFMELNVYIGGQVREDSTKKISIETLRKHYAYLSSCISYVIDQGIPIINHPLTIIQTYINPKIKEKKSGN